MKVERISENQIKVMMSAQDLFEKNVSVSELSRGTEKGRALFYEILTEMREYYDFELDEAYPIAVEVIPSKNDITLVITKITRSRSVEPFFPSRFVPHPRGDNFFVYEFNALDDATDAVSSFIKHAFAYDGDNTLFKMNGKYYLVLSRDFVMSEHVFLNAEKHLSDFGKRADSSSIFRAFLAERGEVILNRPVQSLRRS